VLLIGLDGIHRAGRVEAAVAAKEGAEDGLIEAYQEDERERGQR
jgi:hypothetical protein